jgi:tetratricopeptide (TPR) repeat protein
MSRTKWTWKEASLPKDLLEKLSARFMTEVYEASLPSDPLQVEVLVALADLYARQGLIEKGLALDLKLVEARPDEPTFHYNLACSHSLLGHIDPAFEALERAIQLGYKEWDHLRKDPDLANLKEDVRFQQMLKDLAGKKKAKG